MLRKFCFFRKVAVLSAATIAIGAFAATGSGQIGNTISGHVFGLERRPLSEVNVELLDDLSRTIARGRTSSAGRFFFSGLPSGRFKVRVLPFGTDYEEQEVEVEIVNFSRGTGSGDNRTIGMSNEQKDVYLRLKKGAPLGSTGAVFVQEVPSEAKKLYDEAVANLEKKKEKEAYEGLKKAIEHFPKYFAALELLGTEYVKAGHFEAAQVLLTMALEVNDRSFKSWHGLAYSLYQQKKYDEASVASQKTIALNGSSAEALLLSGALARHFKKHDDAEKQLTKARELSGDSIPEVHWELALLYANDLKRYREAARELRLYLKARPDARDAENIRKLIDQLEQKAKG